MADALGVDEATLPPGDLPVARLAERFLGYLRDTVARETVDDHPEFWTYALVSDLAADAPDLGLATVLMCLAGAETPEEAAQIAAGPLEDLIAQHGPALIDEIEVLATRAPRFAYALTGVWPQGNQASLLWARVEAARRDVPSLDDGAPLPPPDGLG